MPQWPAGLPVRPPDGSWAIDIQDPAIRTQPDIGPPMVRARYSIEWERWQGTLTLTKDEYEQMREFWKTDCEYGSTEFTAFHWEDFASEHEVDGWRADEADLAASVQARLEEVVLALAQFLCPDCPVDLSLVVLPGLAEHGQ